MIREFILLHIQIIELNMGWNTIETIHPKAFWTSTFNNKTTHTKLKFLDINNNKIHYIKSGTFDPLINLIGLYLYKNMLSNIDNTFIINLNKLEHFSISSNKLTQLPTKWVPNNLKDINIMFNPIDYLSSITFVGAFNLNKIELSLHKVTIGYNTFSNLTKLITMTVERDNLEICTCKYIWYLDTKINSRVCDNSNNAYASVREYLKEECTQG